jgi:hypothetical protein
MNCGLGTLTDLKTLLLLPADREVSDYDTALQIVGRGTASLFESYCGRKFGRLVGDVLEFDPYRLSFTLTRYPIETVTSLELRSTMQEGWVAQADQPVNFRKESGILFFGAVLGGMQDTGRVTWTGGYWFDESEDGTSTMPADATLLPGDLKLAWLQQSKYFWDRNSIIDRAKAGFDSGEGFLSDESELIATVKTTLDSYRRFA